MNEIEIRCPNCEYRTTLVATDETDQTTTYSGECKECKAELSLLVRLPNEAA